MVGKMHKTIIKDGESNFLYLLLTEEQKKLLRLLEEECFLQGDVEVRFMQDNEDLFKIV